MLLSLYVLDHAWHARATGRLSPWAGLLGFGAVLFLSGQLPRVGPLMIQQHRSSHEADGALFFFRQVVAADIGVYFSLAPSTGYLVVRSC